jgi:hypothetical protein
VTTFRDAAVRERQDLQRLLRQRIDVLDADGSGLLVIAEEFSDWQDSSRRIDLLAIDRDANLVVIELKRGETGSHMELQAIRYAAMVSSMTFERAADAFGQYLRAHDDVRDAEDSLLSFLGWDEPREEDFGRDVRIVLVAADFSRELTSSALWLNERGLDVRCVRVRPHSLEGRIVLDVQQIIPLPEATDYTVRFAEKSRQERQAIRTRAPWTGFWFVNTGMESPQLQESHGRHWNNCRSLGYVAAGGGPKWSGALKRLTPGDPVFAYVSKAGYVGYGKVSRAATPVHLFVLPDGKSLNEHLNRFWKNDNSNEERWEYAVGVDWEVTYSIDDAKWFPGAFANQNAVCKLRHHETLDFLVKAFRAEADLGPSAHPERHASGSDASDE